MMRYDVFPERNIEPPENPEAPQETSCPVCGGKASLVWQDDAYGYYRCVAPRAGCPEDEFAVDLYPDPDSTGCAHEPYDAWVERHWR